MPIVFVVLVGLDQQSDPLQTPVTAPVLVAAPSPLPTCWAIALHGGACTNSGDAQYARRGFARVHSGALVIQPRIV